MPKFSQKSIDKLLTCHKNLQLLCLQVIQHIDFTVLSGHRSDTEQLEAVFDGKSRLGPEESKHCLNPSRAVDIIQYLPQHPHIDFSDREMLYHLAGWMLATAQHMGIGLRWGGDWNQDGNPRDNTFDDLCHFELTR